MIALVVAGCGASSTSAHVGAPAPAIKGPTVDGSTVDLAAYRGHPVVVNFWASWCTPCRDEFPMFRDKLATLGPTDGLVILGVLYKDQPDLANQFLADFGATWPTATDPDGSIASSYLIAAPPQTFFIDKDGIVRAVQVGELRPEVFDTQYAKIKP